MRARGVDVLLLERGKGVKRGGVLDLELGLLEARLCGGAREIDVDNDAGIAGGRARDGERLTGGAQLARADEEAARGDGERGGGEGDAAAGEDAVGEHCAVEAAVVRRRDLLVGKSNAGEAHLIIPFSFSVAVSSSSPLR